MPKTIPQNVAKQIKQIGEETLKEAVKQPGEAAGQALEQVGGGTANPKTTGQKTNSPQSTQKRELKEKEAQDKLKTEKEMSVLLKELEGEIEKYRRLRAQQLAQRRQAAQPVKGDGKEKPEVIEAPSGKKPKGLMAGLRSRKRSSQPELAGGRRSG